MSSSPVTPLPAPATAAAPLLTPAVIARRNGQWHVSVLGLPVGLARNKATATTMLAREALAKKVTIVAEVREGQMKTYLSFSPTGEVRPAAPPPPGTLQQGFDLPTEEASRQAVEDSTREWVEDTLLVAAQAEQARQRRWMPRRRR